MFVARGLAAILLAAVPFIALLSQDVQPQAPQNSAATRKQIAAAEHGARIYYLLR